VSPTREDMWDLASPSVWWTFRLSQQSHVTLLQQRRLLLVLVLPPAHDEFP